MMKAAATLRTLGYLHKATIVNRLPARPTIMMMIATTAAKVLKGFGNLRQIKQSSLVITCLYLINNKIKFRNQLYISIINNYRSIKIKF